MVRTAGGTAREAAVAAYCGADGEQLDFDRAYGTFRLLAANGDLVAAGYAHLLSFFGEGAIRDPEGGAVHLRRLAPALVRRTGTDADAACLLAWAEMYGALELDQTADAYDEVRRAAEGGYAPAQMLLGNGLLAGRLRRDPPAAAAWYRQAQAQGDARSATDLAWICDRALLPGRGPADARSLYAEAARQGEPSAQFDLGTLYAGNDLASRRKAAACYDAAAAGGHPGAQFNLGCLYACAGGVPLDYRKAAGLFRKVIGRRLAGGQPCIRDLWWLPDDLTAGDPRTVRRCLAAGALGDPVAQLELALMRQHGWGLPADRRLAAGWFVRAAEGGHPVAQFVVGGMCERSGRTIRDLSAADWYGRAALQGHRRAQYRLGLRFMNGQGAPLDLARGARWLRKAAAPLPYRQQRFGVTYLNGDGVPLAAEAVRARYTAGDRDAVPRYNFDALYSRGQERRPADWLTRAADTELVLVRTPAAPVPCL